MNKQSIKTVFQPAQALPSLEHQQVSVASPARLSRPNQQKNKFKLIAGSTLVALLLIGGLVASQGGLLQNQDQRSQAADVLGVTAGFSSTAVSVSAGEAGRTQVHLKPKGETVPTAAEIIITYDPNAIEILDFSAGKDFPTVLVPARNDDQSGVATITVARQPESTQTGLELAAVSISFRVKPGSTSTKLSIDTASEVAAVGSNSNVLQSADALQITAPAAADDPVSDRESLRERLQEDLSRIEPLPSPIIVPSGSPKPRTSPGPSFEPIPPQL